MAQNEWIQSFRIQSPFLSPQDTLLYISNILINNMPRGLVFLGMKQNQTVLAPHTRLSSSSDNKIFRKYCQESWEQSERYTFHVLSRGQPHPRKPFWNAARYILKLKCTDTMWNGNWIGFKLAEKVEGEFLRCIKKCLFVYPLPVQRTGKETPGSCSMSAMEGFPCWLCCISKLLK